MLWCSAGGCSACKAPGSQQNQAACHPRGPVAGQPSQGLEKPTGPSCGLCRLRSDVAAAAASWSCPACHARDAKLACQMPCCQPHQVCCTQLAGTCPKLSAMLPAFFTCMYPAQPNMAARQSLLALSAHGGRQAASSMAPHACSTHTTARHLQFPNEVQPASSFGSLAPFSICLVPCHTTLRKECSTHCHGRRERRQPCWSRLASPSEPQPRRQQAPAQASPESLRQLRAPRQLPPAPPQHLWDPAPLPQARLCPCMPLSVLIRCQQAGVTPV